MAEEDMLYGKARHLFGGIEPSNMKAFSVTAPGSGRPVITAVLPDNTVLDGQTLRTDSQKVHRLPQGRVRRGEGSGNHGIYYLHGRHCQRGRHLLLRGLSVYHPGCI